MEIVALPGTKVHGALKSTSFAEAVEVVVEKALKGVKVVVVGDGAWDAYLNAFSRLRVSGGNIFLLDAVDRREARPARVDFERLVMARIAYTARRRAEDASLALSGSRRVSRRELLREAIVGAALEYSEQPVEDEVLCSKPSVAPYCRLCLEACNGCAASASLCGIELLHVPGYSRAGLHDMLKVLAPLPGPGYVLFVPRSLAGQVTLRLSDADYGKPILMVPVSCPYVVGLEELLALQALGLQPIIVSGGVEEELKGCRGSRRIYEETVALDYMRLIGESLVHTIDETLKLLWDRPRTVAIDSPWKLLTRGLRPLALAAVKKLGVAVKLSTFFSGIVVVDQASCTLCGACANACPSAALRVSETSSHTALLFSADRCIACSRCVDSCPEEALRLTRAVNAALIGRWAPLAIQENVRCIVCGKPIGTATMIGKVLLKLMKAGVDPLKMPTLLMCTECRQKYSLGLVNDDDVDYEALKTFVERLRRRLDLGERSRE